MKILTDGKELVGKKIVFTHIAEFADQSTLATDDGGVLMVTSDTDDEFISGKRTRVLSERHVLNVLHSDPYLRKELGALGIFDLEAYKRKQEEKLRVEKEKRQKEREERDRLQLASLMLKFKKDAIPKNLLVDTDGSVEQQRKVRDWLFDSDNSGKPN